ncbi:DNA-binding response regulator [Streptomyces sp. NPDC001922]|uniref:response regulator transcription factor n=1 Tax=Streptomyces sp. NPDC001922 TaxID=3364624 RepID=UPI00369E9341
MLLAGELQDRAALLQLDTVCRALPRTSVVVLSNRVSRSGICAALRVGARGFLGRNVPAGQVVQAVRTVAEGAVALCHGAAQSLGRDAGAGVAKEPTGEPLPHGLTARECDVLRLLARGMTNRGIAAQMMLSPHTVKEHVSAICVKLGASNRVDAAVRASRAGVLGGDVATPQLSPVRMSHRGSRVVGPPGAAEGRVRCERPSVAATASDEAVSG